MRGYRPGKSALIATGALTLLFSCITIPEAPPVETDPCINSFFAMRREVREIAENNEMEQFAILGISAIGLFVPQFLFVGVIGSPITQLHNRNQARELVSDWQEKECRGRDGNPAESTTPAPDSAPVR